MSQASPVASAVARYMASGARVESQNQEMAVVVTGQPTSNKESAIHLVVTIFTAGLWALVWIPMEVVRNARARRIVITADGEQRFRWLFGKWRPC